MSDIPQAPDWWQASDGKWYPPQAGQGAPDPFEQMQSGTPTTPGNQPFANLAYGGIEAASKRAMSLGLIITIVTLVIGGIITAVVLFAVKDASDTIDETFDTDDEAIESVEVTEGGCGRGAGPSGNWAVVNLEVTNNSDNTSTYFIDVTLESNNGDRQFGTASATVTGLAPGRTTEVEATSTDDVPRRFQCTVTSVDRIGAP